jgi:hypothetical protein
MSPLGSLLMYILFPLTDSAEQRTVTFPFLSVERGGEAGGGR